MKKIAIIAAISVMFMGAAHATPYNDYSNTNNSHGLIKDSGNSSAKSYVDNNNYNKNSNTNQSLNSVNSANMNTNVANGGQGGKGGSSSAIGVGVGTGGAGGAGGEGGVGIGGISQGGAGGDQSQGQSVSVNTTYESDRRRRNVGIAYAPDLAMPSNGTCLGSATGGLNVGSFSVAGGSTVIDKNCVTLQNVNQYRVMGFPVVALALMCSSPENRLAMTQSGEKCPGDVDPAQTVQSGQIIQTFGDETPVTGRQPYTGNDDTVMRRIGMLPPL